MRGTSVPSHVFEFYNYLITLYQTPFPNRKSAQLAREFGFHTLART